MNVKGVVKRDGLIDDYDKTKIYNAISKANQSMDENERISDEQIADLTDSIDKEIAKIDFPTILIEDVQDIVEKKMLEHGYRKMTAKYINYRDERTIIRRYSSPFMKKYKEKLDAKKVKGQNANVDEYSFGGRKGEANNFSLKELALYDLMSEKARNAHLNNEIYIHDLDSYYLGLHNCLSIPFDKLLKNGFYTRQVDIRPAASIATAFQLLAVIFQIQSLQQFGGCSATHLDWTMVPYVRKSFFKHYVDGVKYLKFHGEKCAAALVSSYKHWAHNISIDDKRIYSSKKARRYAMDLTKRELKQSVEGMYHNLNSLQSRAGNQLPFTSINYGTCTSIEGRMVTDALLDGLLAGVGKLHKTSIFPCGIFQFSKDINGYPGTPNYDLFKKAIKCTVNRLYPNYVNFDWSGNAGFDINDPRTYMSTMGCRTANGFDINGFGQLKDGRGNICPTTIILPTIAMEAKEALKDGEDLVESFMKLLEKTIETAKDNLIERFDHICSQSPKSADFMWINGTMEGYIPEEGVRSALRHGTLAIGQLGLAECLQILIGVDHTDARGMELAERIEKLYKDKCAEYKKEYKLNFGVYYTPAENLCHTALIKFRDKYGVIPNVSDREYFTNSMHIPVWHKISPFKKILLESKLTGYSSAGCITYVEVGDSATFNEKAIEQLVHYAMEHDIPYFAINVANDTCNNCGYTGVIKEGHTCPKCGSGDISRLRRVTGYLTPDYNTTENKGKICETKDRRDHSDTINDLYSALDDLKHTREFYVSLGVENKNNEE